MSKSVHVVINDCLGEGDRPGSKATSAWCIEGIHPRCMIASISQAERERPPQLFLIQKATLGALGFGTFCFFTCFSTLFFSLIKFLDLSRQKNQSCEKNLGQVHSGLFFFFFFDFFGFFAVPSPTVQKLEENQKKQKKQSCEKNLG